MGSNPKAEILLNRSLFVYEFLKNYHELEVTIRKIFTDNLPEFKQQLKEQLYLYLGGRLRPNIDVQSCSINFSPVKYDENEKFKSFPLITLIRIFEKNHDVIDTFDFAVESVQNTNVEFPFYDCLVRLNRMRNKLAHNLADIKFQNGDTIELLGTKQIQAALEGQLPYNNLENIDDETKCIASNVVFIKKLLQKLEDHVKGLEKSSSY